MKKIFQLFRSPYFMALLVVLIFGIPILLEKWGFAVKVLQAFNSCQWCFVFGCALVVILLRKFALRYKAEILPVSLMFLIPYLLLFQSKLYSPRTEPTLYFILLFLGIITFFTLICYDGFQKLHHKILKVLRLKFLLKPLVRFILSLLSIGVIMIILRTNIARFIVEFYWVNWIGISLLLPLIILLYKKIFLKKSDNYFRGLVIFFMAYVVYHLSRKLFTSIEAKSIAVLWILLIGIKIQVYFDEIKEFLTGRREKVLVKKKEKIDALKGISSKLLNAFKRVNDFISQKLIGFWHGILPTMKVHRKKIIILCLAILLGIIGIKVYPKLVAYFRVTVTEFSPQGQVPPKSVIRATFSEDVTPRVENINELACFNINPQLEGEYRIEGKRTIVFVPKEPLMPSTRYKVRLNPKNLKFPKNKKVTRGNTTEFYTEMFAVSGVKMFYLYDLATNLEKKVMGELNFNYPVELEKLKERVMVFSEKEPISIEFEKSYLPTRFYFKTGLLQRGKKAKAIKFFVREGLECLGGTIPLTHDYLQVIQLPAKIKFQVSDIKLWHEAGKTMITILFNMPVSKDQAQQCVSVEPYIPYTIETEYCYAVLKGNFKPNTSYKVTINEGLISKSGEILEDKKEKKVYIRDLDPQVKFAHSGEIVPLEGEMNIAVKTINLDEVNVTIRKIYRNNLMKFLYDPYNTYMSSMVFSGSYKVYGGKINEELMQYINLKKFHDIPYKGLFQIQISDPKSYYNDSTSWFMCTDIGIVAKRSGDDLIVYTLSIKNLQPHTGTKVRLIADNNQVMDEALTGKDGKVVFKNWQNNVFKFNPYVLVAMKGDDFSYLRFDTTMMNQHRFPIGGTPYSSKGMEAFITPERGVYRPGEEAYITGIVRSKDFSVPPVLPARLVVTDPQGAEFAKIDKKWNNNGVMSFELKFPAHALTGEYYLNLKTIDNNRSLGATYLKVEEFIPDKLKVEIVSDQESVEAGNLLVFSVKGKQMFGPPASGNKLETSVRFLPRLFTHPTYRKYTFQDPSRSFYEETLRLGADTLDENGIKKYEIEVPSIRPPSALNAYIYTEVFDSGGRPVSAAEVIPINPYPYYLGIHIEKEPFYKTGQEIEVDYVAINSEGEPQDIKNVQFLVKRKVWYSFFRRGWWGRSRYQSSTYEEVVLQKVIDIKDKGSFTFTPDVAGEYSVYIGNEDSMRTGRTISVVGVGYQTWGMESPEKLEIGLDKKIYHTGDVATIDIRAPFVGKLFLTIEREKVYYSKVINLKKNTAKIRIPIHPKYLPNVYVVGMLIRTPDEASQTLPMVSFGIVPLGVDKAPRRIPVKWVCKESVESQDGIDVQLKVKSPGRTTNVILAAVDQGILQITNFKTPDPLEFFYRKNSLTTQTYSIFDMVLPDLKIDRLAIGGGLGEEDFTRRHLNPIAAKRPKSLAHYSGILTPDERGVVKYHFDTSDFTGEVRIMAMVIAGNKYGSSKREVTVIDPIVVVPSFPRFASPQDQFEIPVQVYNNTGKSGSFTTTLELEGPIEFASEKEREKTVFLQNKAEEKIVFLVQAKNDAGVARFRLVTKGVGKETVKKAELSIRPVTHLESTVKMGSLKPGKSTTINIPGGFIPFGQKVRLTLSSNPMIQYLRSLDYLIRYPYGCVEQVTSQVFPLIYFKELGFATGIFADKANAVDLYVQAGIDKIEKLQLSDGSFAMWSGGSSASRWLSLYVSHFLIEAQKMGYRVDSRVMSRVKTYIKRLDVIPQDTGRLDRRDHNIKKEIDVYALYLKSLIGTPNRGSMSQLYHHKLDKLGEVDRSLLSLTYSQIGDKETALRILKPDFKSVFLYREQYGSFNSPIRNTAMYLSALASADPESRKIDDIIKYLGENMKNGHFGNTQENAWVFMSLGKALQSKDYEIKAQILIDEKPYRTIEGKTKIIKDPALTGKKMELKNIGQKKNYYYFLAEGVPLEKNKKSRFKGIEISRGFRNEKGRKVNLTSVPQGTLIIVTIRIKPQKGEIHNAIIVDILPGGFEVENPRLSSRGSLGFQPGMSLSPAYMDIRDDRILLFVDRLSGDETFSYAVRAVTPGRFTIPNIYAEAMYDPEINGEEYEEEYLVVVPSN